MFKQKLTTALGVVTLILTAAFRAEAIDYTMIGSGSDSSYLVIEGFTVGPIGFQLLYTYDPGQRLDGYFLFDAARNADPLLSADISNFGTSEEPNYFINAVTYGSETFTNTPFPQSGPYWAQWVSGGESGFPTAVAVADGSWSFGSGMSAPYRFLAPGSSDGYIFNEGDAPPSTAPIPEPAVLPLLLAAGIFLALKRRNYLPTA